jgi:hypothetical protein
MPGTYRIRCHDGANCNACGSEYFIYDCGPRSQCVVSVCDYSASGPVAHKLVILGQERIGPHRSIFKELLQACCMRITPQFRQCLANIIWHFIDPKTTQPLTGERNQNLSPQ